MSGQHAGDLAGQDRVRRGEAIRGGPEHVGVVGVGALAAPPRQHLQVDAEAVKDRRRLAVRRIGDPAEHGRDLVADALQLLLGRRGVAVQRRQALHRRLGGHRRGGGQDLRGDRERCGYSDGAHPER